MGAPTTLRVAMTIAVLLLLLSVAAVAVAARRQARLRETFAGEVSGDRVNLVDREGLLSRASPGLHAYFDSFNAADRRARPRCSTLSEYLLCVRRAEEMPVEDVRRLRTYVETAHAIVLRGAPQLLGLPSDGKQVAAWNIAVLDDVAEGGWPHTHGDVICLPARMLVRGGGVGSMMDVAKSGNAVVRVLVHELVHVYQRRFPEETERAVLDAWGMRPLRPRHGDARLEAHLPPWAVPLVRHNPDLDGRAWTGGAADSDCTVAQLFHSTSPASLADSSAVAVCRASPPPTAARRMTSVVAGSEHPYERMAYELSVRLVV